MSLRLNDPITGVDIFNELMLINQKQSSLSANQRTLVIQRCLMLSQLKLIDEKGNVLDSKLDVGIPYKLLRNNVKGDSVEEVYLGIFVRMTISGLLIFYRGQEKVMALCGGTFVKDDTCIACDYCNVDGCNDEKVNSCEYFTKHVLDSLTDIGKDGE